MSVRPFDWRDLPGLHRRRNESIFLDSTLMLTRGPLLVPGALLSYLSPAMGIFTCVSSSEDCESALIGQIMHALGSPVAHLTFFTPVDALETSAFAPLLDYFVQLAGERGAFRLLAEVDERSVVFEALRRQSFAVYTRQRIWQLTGSLSSGKPGLVHAKDHAKDNGGNSQKSSTCWRAANKQDNLRIRSLYSNLVPGLVQQVEPFSNGRGMVYCQGDELLAYVELKYGYRGIWAQPFVHPDAEDVIDWFVDLFENLPYRRSRPVYICVRSYQAWLEAAIEELGAEAGPRQAVMVKQLAIPQKAVRVFSLPALEGGHAEVSAPIARSERKILYYGTEKDYR